MFDKAKKPPLVQDYSYQVDLHKKRGIKSVNFILGNQEAIMLQEMCDYYGVYKRDVITKALEDYLV